MASRVPSKDVSKDTLLGSRESERSLVSRSWQTGIRRGERYNYLIEFIRPTLVDLSRDDRFSLPTSRRHHCSSPNFRPIFFFSFFFFFALFLRITSLSQLIHNQFKKWQFVTRNLDSLSWFLLI